MYILVKALMFSLKQSVCLHEIATTPNVRLVSENSRALMTFAFTVARSELSRRQTFDSFKENMESHINKAYGTALNKYCIEVFDHEIGEVTEHISTNESHISIIVDVEENPYYSFKDH